MANFRDRAADVLVLQGIVTPELIAPFIDEFGSDVTGFRNALVHQGITSHLEIAEAVGLIHNLPVVDLMSYPIDQDVVSLIPGSIAQKYSVLPIRVSNNQLTLAMVDPGNVIAVDDVATVTGMVVNSVVAAQDGMAYALNRFVRADSELSELSTEMEQTAATMVRNDFETDEDDDAPIVRFVNLLISQAIQDRASDIHVEPQEHDLRVRYRIDGVMHEVQSASVNIRDAVISRLKIMSEIDIAERRRPQDGRISVSHHGRRVDLRVATLPTVWGEKVVLRILDNSANSLSIQDLAMTEHNLKRYERSYTRPNGMILLTGPTGSGKSTTLYATLSTVSNATINVI
ncbi:MAG: ATPase, T2SS/T4P/T4SS family, partial [Microbacteriaceae bacterium]